MYPWPAIWRAKRATGPVTGPGAPGSIGGAGGGGGGGGGGGEADLGRSR